MEGGRSREPADLSQPSTSRRPSPASTSVAAVTPESSTPDVVRSRWSGRRTVSVPLDLALPRFAAPDFRAGHLQARWVCEYDSLRLGSALIWTHCLLTVQQAQWMSLLTPFVFLMCRFSTGT